MSPLAGISDRVDVPDVAQEPVAQPSPLLAPATKPEMSTNSIALRARRREHALDLFKRLVAHLDHAHVGSIVQNGVGRHVRLPAVGEGVEQGGLAGVGQPMPTRNTVALPYGAGAS